LPRNLHRGYNAALSPDDNGAGRLALTMIGVSTSSFALRKATSLELTRLAAAYHTINDSFFVRCTSSRHQKFEGAIHAAHCRQLPGLQEAAETG
jgi:hypothetical protein